jgi:pyrimidine-nucleoside phosphorylase
MYNHFIVREDFMRAVDIITKKRDGGELTQEEINFFIQGFTRGDIPDYQAAAWAMAVLQQGMTTRETVDLTQAMVASGDRLDLASVAPIGVDKHSTGGVGDKTTLVVQPIVAACDVPVGKMSGRGLGYSGGTLDKMESIEGFRADLTTEEFLDQLQQEGLVLSGQTLELAPADGKLYALRDVTGTVASLPLIASSVMSKKIAAGAHALVLDVKVGCGAFMGSVKEAVELAELMVEIARHHKLRAVALISDMSQPLGSAVGNALEVKEAIETLCGAGPQDFKEHCLEIAGHMLMLADKADDLESAKQIAAEMLGDGSAYEKFKTLVAAQGGNVQMVENPGALPRAKHIKVVNSPREGNLSIVDAREVGLTAVALGAGRAKKEDVIDHAVGVVIHRNVGDHVGVGDPLFTVHANDPVLGEAAIERLMAAHEFVSEPVDPLPLFYRTIKN